MIERCFQSSVTLRRLAEGPAGPFLDGFAGALFAKGYSPNTCGRYLCTASLLGEWAGRRGIALADLDEGILARFVLYLTRCQRSRHDRYKQAPFQAHRFLRYLREAGAVASCAPKSLQSSTVTELVAWMRDQRGLAETTIAHTVRVVQALLDAVGEEPTRFDAVGVRYFVLGYVRQHAPASAGLVTTSVRRFLRYLVARGRCSPDLIEAVPRVPTWQMARLPRYLPSGDVERIIAACAAPDGTELRNGALLLLLARLGLRSHEVVGLRLGDIDWKEGRLRVLGKARRETRLPLPQDVGDAILRYLEAERPTATTDYIFLTSRAPIGPLSTAGLRDVVGRAIERAGVQAPSRGTHILRHSLATSLLREGASLDAIGAVLRHRNVDTTALYAKVDVDLLRQVAQPWPGAELSPC
jgi:site-specific recombinase XerD